MMTKGRLRAIESYTARAGSVSKEILAKVNLELIAEVHRLRASLQWIAEHRHSMDLAGHAGEALREPAVRPDIVCRRGTAADAQEHENRDCTDFPTRPCRNCGRTDRPQWDGVCNDGRCESE